MEAALAMYQREKKLTKTQFLSLFFFIGIFIVILYFLHTMIYNWQKSEMLFLRYQITVFREARDYINNVSVENFTYAYEEKNGYLYLYGIGGYTRVKLGLLSEVLKIPNEEYYRNLHLEDGRGMYRSTLWDLQNVYGNKILIQNNFDTLSYDEIKIFKKLKCRGEDMLQFMEKMDSEYGNLEIEGMVKNKKHTEDVYNNLKYLNLKLQNERG